MLPTESANQSHIQDDRQRLLNLLDRQEVIDELEKYGISKVEAVARINSLTDEEVIVIAGKLDELPAGQLEGAVYAIFALGLVAYAAGYVFIWFPGLLLFCPFSDDSYGECISSNSGKYWSALGRALEGGGEGYDPSAGLEYCKADCQSDFKSCMESADGEKDEEQECEVDNNTCDKKCSDWANPPGDGSIIDRWFGSDSGGEEEIQDGYSWFNIGGPTKETITKAQCYSHCYTGYHGCINSGDGTVSWESQCGTEKQSCSQQCESQARRKWCQNPDTKEWILCEEQKQ